MPRPYEGLLTVIRFFIRHIEKRPVFFRIFRYALFEVNLFEFVL